MPTFTLPDPYDGWSEERLKVRIRELIHALIRTERIAAMLVEFHPQSVSQLPEQYREKAVNLNAAYRDGDIDIIRTDTGSVT